MSGGIVFAGASSHVPYITALPDAPSAEARDRIYAAMRELGERLRQAKPDALVVVSSDHFNNFFTACLPPFCVGVADKYDGPVEGWIRVRPMSAPGHPAFANALLSHAYSAGFDLAFTRELRLEHGVLVPLTFMDPQYQIPLVPLIQNCMVPPLPSIGRCVQLGELLRQVAQRSGLRIAVLGTGGLSHSPGAPEAGEIDEAFDRRFLALLSAGQREALLNIDNREIDAAGFGAWEVRQWYTAFGAVGGRRAEVLAYEPITEWETGCAVAVFDL
jgi:aromatic ring-opening dioxygenase catalytic subunit (LigB family)